jgi:hypothetical protein
MTPVYRTQQHGIELQPSLELQHINVRLPLKDPENIDFDAVIPVFHSWIQGQVCVELLLDVADYRHVHGGSGIVLIGHEADYSLDNTDNRWGIRYNRKTAVHGDNQKRLERLLAPNREEIREALTPDFQTFAEKLFEGSDYSLSFEDEPRRLFRVFLNASRSFTVHELLNNLAS